MSEKPNRRYECPYASDDPPMLYPTADPKRWLTEAEWLARKRSPVDDAAIERDMQRYRERRQR